MKKISKVLGMVLLAVGSFSTANASPDLRTSARNVSYMARDLYEYSYRVASYQNQREQFALQDLGAVVGAADQFVRFLDFNTYRGLANAMERSRVSWRNLRGYANRPRDFDWVFREYLDIRYVMDHGNGYGQPPVLEPYPPVGPGQPPVLEPYPPVNPYPPVTPYPPVGPGPSGTTVVVGCASLGRIYFECETGLARARYITLVSQSSNSACIPGQTFGLNGNKVWVDSGCRGRFQVTGR